MQGEDDNKGLYCLKERVIEKLRTKLKWRPFIQLVIMLMPKLDQCTYVHITKLGNDDLMIKLSHNLRSFWNCVQNGMNKWWSNIEDMF